MEINKSKYTETYIKELIKGYKNGEFELIEVEKFDGCKSRVTVKHIPCGRILKNQILSNLVFLDRGCKFCNSNKFDNKKIVDTINLEKDYFTADKTVERVSDFIEITHKTCGTTFKMRVTDFLYNKHRCPKCFGKKTLTYEDISKRVSEIDNGEYELVEIINNDDVKPSRRKIKVKHKTCGTISTIILHNFLNNGQRCKNCSKNILGFRPTSKLALLVESFLSENNISFEKEKKFKGLKYKRSLKIDFYIEFENMKIAIECDGKQHFITNEHNKIFTPESVELQKIRDSIKDKYCQDNNITIIRFNFKESDNDVITKLKSIFNKV